VLFAAKCYWPGVTEDDLESVSLLVPREQDTAYLGSLFFPGDALVLCLFEGGDEAAVRAASERARIPCERVMSTWWVTDERSLGCSKRHSS
jgi:hypothetical protein